MFEAVLAHADILKRVLDSIKELVEQANLEITPQGISMQAMDSSHVSLIELLMKAEGFEVFNTQNEEFNLGINLASLAKVLKCANATDSITMKHEDESDVMNFTFKTSDGSKVSEFVIKLIDLDGDSLVIPGQEYKAWVDLPSVEFQRLCRDMAVFGEQVSIEVNKDGVRFKGDGEIGAGQVYLHNSAMGSAPVKLEVGKKEEAKEEVKDVKVEDAKDDEDGDVKVEDDKKDTVVKEENVKDMPDTLEVKLEPTEEANEEDTKKATEENKEETTNIEDWANDKPADEKPAKKEKKESKKAESATVADKDDPNRVGIKLEEPVELNFALKYLASFTKGTGICNRVRLSMAKEVPLVCEYRIRGPDDNDMGYLKYYLAPKVEDGEEEEE